MENIISAFIILHILNILPIVIVSGSASIWLHSNIIKIAVNFRYLGGRRKQHILDFFISRDSKKIKDIVKADLSKINTVL